MSRRISLSPVTVVAQLLFHRSMIMELVLIILASLLRSAAAVVSYGSCMPARCGDLSISDPFSLGGVQPVECGFPAFELACEVGQAYLTRSFRERLYRVLNISYDTNSILVAVETTFSGDDTCRVPDFNISTSLALYPLNISDRNKYNLVFFYNCKPPPEILLSPSCVNHTIGAYVSERRDTEGAPPQWVPRNCSSVSVPVLAFQEEKDPAHDYQRLISEGFFLEWPASGECDACRRRGGECRTVGLSFQCFCDGRPCPIEWKKHSNNIILIVSVLAATSLTLTSIVWIMYRRKKKQNLFFHKYTGNESNIEEMLKGHDSLTLKRYRYSELRKITGSFKEKLGEGGHGTVFKGNLEDGRMVAVKMLKGSKGNGEDFLNEVVSIRRTSHVNIVNLIGFCLHGSKRALIYEYMANGSLDKYIYSEESKMAIGWDKLKLIAIGIARGLEYLHRGCNTRIIHFDIKPHNVLLDEDFCPKIADFGLAKLCRLKDSVLSIIEARGTIGFIAPEVFSRGFGVVSTKSDVYSYGMVLLEMIGGRTNVKENTENSSEAYFPNWIYDRLVKDLHNNEVTCETQEIARQISLVGLWCIQTSPVDRPSMSRVIEMLENNISELEMPPKPFLSLSITATMVFIL